MLLERAAAHISFQVGAVYLVFGARGTECWSLAAAVEAAVEGKHEGGGGISFRGVVVSRRPRSRRVDARAAHGRRVVERPARSDVEEAQPLVAASTLQRVRRVLTCGSLAATPRARRRRADALPPTNTPPRGEPRFVVARLLPSCDGPEGEFPPMDPNGLADPYVVLRLQPAPERGGARARYPPGGVRSHVQYRTLRPTWRNERLELALRGGRIDDEGVYHNAEPKRAMLHVEVCDADMGVWGWLLVGAELALLALAAGAVAAYVSGALDEVLETARRRLSGASSGSLGFVIRGAPPSTLARVTAARGRAAAWRALARAAARRDARGDRGGAPARRLVRRREVLPRGRRGARACALASPRER